MTDSTDAPVSGAAPEGPAAHLKPGNQNTGELSAAVLDARKERPVLAVHQALSSAGGGGEPLRPGYLAVVNDLPATARASLHVEDGRLHGADGQLAGCGFLLLRIECQRERDDWRFPQLEGLRKRAIEAYHLERFDEFEKLQKLAIAEVFNSADLTESDAYRSVTR